MPRFHWTRLATPLLAVLALMLIAGSGRTHDKGAWQNSFAVDKSNLVNTGKSAYFVLQPGYRLHFTHGEGTLTVTVLNDTKMVDGVETRVVEERETKKGALAEVSRNYFAMDRTSGDLYYFGEDVDIYKNGKIVDHEGAWLAGVNGAHFGLYLPGKPKIGDKFYLEMAPKVAMDKAEIVSLTEEVRVPAGTFKNCLRTRETSDLEMGSEGKWYAPGVGLIKDSEFVLVEIGQGKQ